MKTNEFEIVRGGSNDIDEGREGNVLLEKKSFWGELDKWVARRVIQISENKEKSDIYNILHIRVIVQWITLKVHLIDFNAMEVIAFSTFQSKYLSFIISRLDFDFPVLKTRTSREESFVDFPNLSSPIDVANKADLFQE